MGGYMMNLWAEHPVVSLILLAVALAVIAVAAIPFYFYFISEARTELPAFDIREQLNICSLICVLVVAAALAVIFLTIYCGVRYLF